MRTIRSIAGVGVIGNHAGASPRVKVNGGCSSEEVCVGAGATLVHQVSAGSWLAIEVRAVVTEDFPENVVAVGMPARVVRSKAERKKP